MSLHRGAIEWLSEQIPNSKNNHYSPRQIKVGIAEGKNVIPDIIEGEGDVYHEVEAKDIHKEKYALLNKPKKLWVFIRGIEPFDETRIFIVKSDTYEPVLKIDLNNVFPGDYETQLLIEKHSLRKEIENLKSKKRVLKTEISLQKEKLRKEAVEGKGKFEKEIADLIDYLDSYDMKIIKQLREKENVLKATTEVLAKKVWFMNTIKNLSNAKINVDKNCKRCPFFISWMKETYQREFGVDPYLKVEEEPEMKVQGGK